jgi:HrpA-like RNA helicase
MKPSTISQISLEGEDQLLSLIHRLNNLSPGLEDNIEFEELSNSSKKNIARTLIRNDRRISNQEKQEKFLLKQSEKEAKAEQYNRHMNSFDLSETNFNLKLDFQSKTLVESDVLTIPSENLLTLRDEQSFNLPETRNSLDSSDVIPIGLPILHQPVKEELLKTIDQNSVVVIVGETGCGKSTQVPQIILDSLPMSNIVCTQPRRIAAISIAERVSTEMGQPCGDLVGYHVRLQSSYGQQSRILYCTTGILLKKLQDPSYLQTISHVIIDEVHERQVLFSCLRSILASLGLFVAG